MDTIFDLQTKLGIVGAELQKISAELIEKAGDPNVPIEDIDALETKEANLQKRFDIIKSKLDKLKAEQEARLKKKRQQDTIASAKNDEARIVAAKAEFIRAKVEGREMSPEARNVLEEIQAQTSPLQAIPAGGGTGGENLLPTTQDKELIHEPFVRNPLRGKIGMTSIKGLEMPKIDFTLDNDDFITDEDTAKEMEATGDKVEFGKNKFKVKVRISDTVLHGADIELVSYVERALRSGLAAKEKKTSFAEHAIAPGTEVHMSFYAEDGVGATLIKDVERPTLFKAIKAAIADLHEDFRENAQVCMRYIDYVDMLEDLSQASIPLYGKQPEEVIGAPTFFSDKATIPIIGDFRFYHLNYDPETIYDSDKDVDKGEYLWVLTAWFDQQFKLRSAFRLATVEAPPL